MFCSTKRSNIYLSLLNIFLIILAPVSAYTEESEEKDIIEVLVTAPKVSINRSASTYQTVVTELRYDPLVDLQSRNFAEAQSDITIRGGLFDHSEISVGAASLYDPQTGHYTAEVPIAPSMLSNPQVRTGLEQSLYGYQGIAGAIAYDFSPVHNARSVSLGVGDRRFNSQAIDLSHLSDNKYGIQLSANRSDQNGTRLGGESELFQGTARFQYRQNDSQTDFLYGHLDKDISWPNLYALQELHTLVGSSGIESDRTITKLALLNHKVKLENDSSYEISAWHRQLKDDYEFDVCQPNLFNLFQHETKISGLGLNGQRNFDDYFVKYNSVITYDEIDSTALVFGKYDNRAAWTVSMLPGMKIPTGKNDSHYEIYAGPRYDDSNRSGESLGLLSGVALVDKESAQKQSRYYFEVAQSSQLANYTALNSNSAAGLFRGNADLKRLRSTNYELGAQLAKPNYSYKVATFYRTDNNLTDWTYEPSIQPFAARSANNVDVDVLGAESSVSLIDDLNRKITFGYTYLTKDSNYGDNLASASFYALNYARHRAAVNLSLPVMNQVDLLFDNEIRRQASNDLRNGTRTPVISSLALSYKPTSSENLTLVGVVDNLFNSTFEEVPGVPPQGRIFAFNMTLNW